MLLTVYNWSTSVIDLCDLLQPGPFADVRQQGSTAFRPGGAQFRRRSVGLEKTLAVRKTNCISGFFIINHRRKLVDKV